MTMQKAQSSPDSGSSAPDTGFEDARFRMTASSYSLRPAAGNAFEVRKAS